MAATGFFENHYEDYSVDIAQHVLGNSNDEVSDELKGKLKKFKSTKLHVLTTTMEPDIFCDGTVYTGSAGLAFYYFMCSLGRNEASHETLKTSLYYVNIEKLKGRRISFLCGDAGPLALATVISYRMGARRPESLPDYKIIADRLMALISLLNESPDELLYGKCGYLYALLFVNKYAGGKDVIPPTHIEKVINHIIKSGKQLSDKMKSDCPLIWQWHEKVYFGAAHGMSGILYMLLQARMYISVVDMRNFVKPTIDWLLQQRYRSGNFPSSLGSASKDRLVQWCHGAPGFVPLCTLAYQVFEEDKYLKIALECGEVVWQRGLCTKGYSICHGVSGNTYTFIQLYQLTKDPVQLYRACCFTEWCAVERQGTELHRPDRPASLFEGLVGRLYLAEDLTRVMDAKFPAFTL